MQVPPARGTWNPQDYASFWINEASRRLMRAHDDRLRPFGFSLRQLHVLVALDEGGSMSQKDLVARMRVEQPSMAEMLARMERDGVVRRRPHPSDKRASLLSLTPRAKARLVDAKEALRESADAATAGFDEQEKQLFVQQLRRVVENLAPGDWP